MEIEAKFAIPNRQVYRDFLRLRQLAGYELIPTGPVNVTDHYVDTDDARLLAAGYACRLRVEGAAVLVSLKGLGGAEGAIHHRDEQEVRLPDLSLDARTWPPSPARDLALNLAGDAPLQLLFDLEQHRVRADVVAMAPDSPRRVAQFSLDAVRAAVGRRPAFYYELEVELTGEGTEADLARIAQELAGVYHLTPEPRSKFERGLATLQSRGAAVETRLSATDRAALERWAAHPDPELAHRAVVILGWAEGLPTREIVARSGLSAGRVRFWVRAFRDRQMGIFEADEGRKTDAGSRKPDAGSPTAERPERRTTTSERNTARSKGRAAQPPPPSTSPRAAQDAPQSPTDTAPATKARATKRQGLPSVLEFCRQNDVDLAHARCVAEHSEKLFNLLRPVHGLPRKRRKLLRQAALLSTVGVHTDPERPHRAGRDLILAQPLHDVATGDRLSLACVVAFQRGKVKPEKEPTMAALEPKQRAQVLSLAALLQVAEALDFSRSQATRIQAAEGVDTPWCEIALTGPSAEVDALQARERAGLWRQLYEQELVFGVDEGQVTDNHEQAAEELLESVAHLQEALHSIAGPRPVARDEDGTDVSQAMPAEVEPLLPDEPMSEAGRKLLSQHLDRMLANEPGTRAGTDIEALHDMRVATRRMRAAYGIFAEYYDHAVLNPFNKGLRRIGRSLGAVRDLDVLIETAEGYQAGVAPDAERDISPLLDDWHAHRAVARRQMLDYLDGAAYRNFVAAFTAFLATPGAGAVTLAAEQPVPYLVRHVVPRLIFTRYEAVRAYEPVIATAPLTTYHLLRIDCKRLRYALEFFRAVLGPEAPALIKQVTALQDILGGLQDAHVAEGLIEEFLRSRPKGKKKAPVVPLTGVEHYLAAQRTIQQELLVQFPSAWAELTGPDFRRALALAVAVL